MVKKTLHLVAFCCVIALLLAFLGHAFSVLAEEPNPRQQAREAISRGLDESLGMPILKGDLWQKMSHDEKVAFIWGFGHVVSIEQYLMEKYPELKREGFVAKVIEGMANTSMNDVISRVDKYYEMNPNEKDKPVTSVLWDTLIRPNIKTGIAGRPLKTNQ